MKWTACTASLLFLVGFPFQVHAQEAGAARAPFDCPMPVVGPRGAERLEPPPSVPPRPRRPPGARQDRAPHAMGPGTGAARSVPMPTLRSRCFNPLALKFEPPVGAPAPLLRVPEFFDGPEGRDSALPPDGGDRFRLDGSMGLTPPRGE